MRDITLKITGSQKTADKEDEQMEFITEGKLYEKSESLYLIYEESEFSGFPGCKTSLKLTGSTVRMKRIGSSSGYGAELVFQEGKRFSSQYQTPFGEMDLEVLTSKVENNLSPEGLGRIEINYRVSLGGIAEGNNRLIIEVME